MSRGPPEISGINTPLEELPPPFQMAIRASRTGRQGQTSDDVVGSYSSGGAGYCSRPPYASQPWCACVNVPKGFPNAVCTFAPCANALALGNAYVPSGEQVFVGDRGKCGNVTVCLQEVNVHDQDNIVQGVKQIQNCGPGSKDKKNHTYADVDGLWSQLQGNATYVVILLVVLVVVALIVASSSKSSSKSADGPRAAAQALPSLPPLPK